MTTKSGSASNVRRSGRRNANVYKKGDYVELFINGGTVTGRLLEKRSSLASSGHPIWIVCPSDRRRRNEEVPESALGRVIDVDEAMNNKSLAKATRNLNARNENIPNNGSGSNSNSDVSDQGELNEEVEEEADDFSEENSKAHLNRKRKGDDSIYGDRISDARSPKRRKTVTFQESGKYSPTPSSAASSSKRFLQDKKGKSSSRIGTRSSTRRSSDCDPNNTRDGNGGGYNSNNNFDNLDLLPANPTKKKKKNKKKGVFKGNLGKKLSKDENVVVVKMLTGTLYLFRGERPRAEFVRSK